MNNKLFDIYVTILKIEKFFENIENNFYSLELDDRIRFNLLKNKSDQCRFLSGRYLRNKILNRFVGINKWKIDYNVFGRPIVKTKDDVFFDFNITHSGSYIAIISSSNGRVGIDLEPFTSGSILDGTEKFFLADPEIVTVSRLSSTQSVEVRLKIWTAKEAILKAWGTGFSIDPRTLLLHTDLSANRWHKLNGKTLYQWIDVNVCDGEAIYLAISWIPLKNQEYKYPLLHVERL